MEYRHLGDSGLEISILSFGAWQIGDSQYWGVDASADYDSAVHVAVDAGINLFDSAEMYGNGESERALGRALGSLRENVLIASKVLPQHAAPEKLREACENSLARLNTDCIDLYQMHWPARDVPFADSFAAMEQLRQDGKIRAIGVSNFGVKDLELWLTCGTCVSNQLGYNLASRVIEHEILPECMKRGVAVLAYMPLLQGILSGRWKKVDEIPQLRRRTRHFAAGRPGVRHSEAGCEEQLISLLDQLHLIAEEVGQTSATVALAWIIAQPGITSAIVGARNSAQLKRNLAAANLHLSRDLLVRLDTISAPLKSDLGTNADLWQSPGRIQ